MTQGSTRRAILAAAAILFPASRARSAARELRLSAMGALPDGTIEGRGSDNAPALRRLFNAAAFQGYDRIILEPGVYCFDGTLACIGPDLGDLTIEAWGVTLIGRKPAAQPGDHFLRLRNTADQGGALTISGLELAMSRPSVRTSNVDMLLIEGFRSTLLDELSIPCADNMGVAFDRASNPDWVPEEIVGRKLRIGGRIFEQPHSHGSIGDTGIWIPRGAKWIDVDAKIQSTGDDACYLGPVPERDGQPVVRAGFKLHLETFQTVGAFHTELPNGVMTGSADTTLTAAVACSPALDGGLGARLDNLFINVAIANAGMLTAGAIGSKIIPQVNACGIWLYGSGRGIDLSGTTIRNVKGPSILLQTRSGQTLEAVRGALIAERIMVTRNGAPLGGDAAIIKRSATGAGVVRDINLTLDIRDSTCPIVSWMQSGPLDDSDVVIRAQMTNCGLDARAYPARALANFATSGAGAPKRIRLDFSHLPTSVRPLRLTGGARAKEFSVRASSSPQRPSS